MLNKIIEVKVEEMKNFVLPEQRQDYKIVSLYDALSSPNRSVGLIAEVKKASPSKGIIRKDFNPLSIATDYVYAGADAISVLTDAPFFQGSKEYLSQIKEAVDVPLLRKDFIVDNRQILESKHLGADAILLIGEVLEPSRLVEFYIEAEELGLECIVEVHSIETIEKLLKRFTPKIIGINNRDLSSFQTSIEQTEVISSYIPPESLIVSESGIFTHADIEYVKEKGADAVLIGEAIMRKQDVVLAIKELFGENAHV
ncbi:indole-3-glycerol phosphate synthase TrpC [Bacillus suaedaesalsae]|uniref:Indole-3-glycerol phosphate synthase n=1 Tax=Bacillus suaedaesalsae TaxID=2810349 RepID=A0ABS2DQ19_9BACI|nr:indole-3-glycerol phosphate synthase TrpC [Bacillus suaedaesalsae]MBM6619858.1 indole-3-glycerol phosphate synthase TrpC [Bacillus suaedaesalsae]